MRERKGTAAAAWDQGASIHGSVAAQPTSTRTPARHEASFEMAAAVVEAFDEAARTASLRLGSLAFTATLDASVDPAVIQTALRRRERLIVQREDEGWIVVGALRTAATPGVDEGDEFMIKARRVAVIVAHEFNVVTTAASFAIRALGQVETLAQDITTRAASVHKIVGRIIRLN